MDPSECVRTNFLLYGSPVAASSVYETTGEPNVFAGAAHLRLTASAVVASTVGAAGAEGAAGAVHSLVWSDHSPPPAVFTACTRNVYDVCGVSPPT